MSILDYFFRTVPQLEDPAPSFKRPAKVVVPPGSVLDPEPDDAGAPVEICRRYYIEPFFLMIDYTDAQGNPSCRRVTMRVIEERHGLYYLQAFCHERQAMRSFRVDRISDIISQDGEVEPAAPWFDEILASAEVEEFDDSARKPARRAPRQPYTILRQHVAQALTLPVAAARSDDFLHPAEIEQILLYCEDEACDLRDQGQLDGLDAGIFDKIERTVRRLRPTRDDVAEAFEAVSGWEQARVERLAKSLARTVRADGRVDALERDLMAELREVGARQFGFGWNS
ncbi:WYL domain-containing protein [Pseudothioclava arenosa]|nr:WYL domain-containing protein [Pseudothioclava arenosa]